METNNRKHAVMHTCKIGYIDKKRVFLSRADQDVVDGDMDQLHKKSLMISPSPFSSLFDPITSLP